MYAEQAGVDKAYIYRADGVEFGLFNDQLSKDGVNKNFATYSAQAMWLYNKFASSRYSSIVKKTDTSKTGITTSGAINKKGNQINILISNYKVDKSIIGNAGKDKLPDGISYTYQYYIDTNIEPQSIIGDMWYGTKIIPPVNNNRADAPLGTFSSNDNVMLSQDDSSYEESSNGYVIRIDDIPDKFTKYSATIIKVFNGSQLLSLEGELIKNNDDELINVENGNRFIIIKDEDPVSAGNNTFALITIDLK